MIDTYTKPLVLARSTTGPSANGTTSYILIWPCLGWGTLRVHIFANQAVTVNFLQRPTGSFTMRQTDTQSVAASTGTPIEFLITSDLLRLDVVGGGTAPTVFELEATLYA